VARVENTMRDVYSVFVVRFGGGQREFSLFNSHKNDSLKSSQQLASVQVVGVESGSVHRRYQEEKRGLGTAAKRK
jgi:hypothetical protein